MSNVERTVSRGLDQDDARLLADCDVDTLRASGPGGQKRNKTESAVRLRHRPTGIIAIAEESRSQAENKARALRRLRKLLALRLRAAVDPEEVPEAVVACIGRKGRLDIGQRDARYLPCVAAVLDVLASHEGVLGDAAKQLGVTTGNLSSFITDDEDVMVEANRLREHFGLRPLRP
jgi:hypothetical protein